MLTHLRSVQEISKLRLALILLTCVSGCAHHSPPEIDFSLPPILKIQKHTLVPTIKRQPVVWFKGLHGDLRAMDFFRSNPDSFAYSSSGVRMFRGNPAHTFYGTGVISRQAPAVLWRFRTGQSFSKTLETPWEGLGWTGQPAVSVEQEGTFVYIASLDGHLYKLDFYTGREVLKSKQNFNIIKSSPSVTDRYVLFGSWDNAVHILDKTTFEVLHREEAIYTPSASYDFDSSPAVDGESFFIGGEDGYVRKVSLEPPFARHWVFPESTPRSDFVYEETGKPYVGIESSVAIAGDRVIVGSGRGKIFILDKKHGELLAQFETGDDTDSSPVVDFADSSFYIGVEQDFVEKPGGLYKLSFDGDSLWFFETGRKGIFSTPALNEKRVIITGDDRYLYSLDKKTGALQWKTRLRDGSWSSPILIADRIVTADYAGYLYGIDAKDGSILWQLKLGNYIVSSPILWQGTILVGTRDGFVYALK